MNCLQASPIHYAEHSILMTKSFGLVTHLKPNNNINNRIKNDDDDNSNNCDNDNNNKKINNNSNNNNNKNNNNCGFRKEQPEKEERVQKAVESQRLS